MSSTSSTDRSDSYYNHSIWLDEVIKTQKSKGKRVTFDTAQDQIYVLPPEDRRNPWIRLRNVIGTAATAVPVIGRAAAAPSNGRLSAPTVTACPGQSPQEEEEGSPIQAACNHPRSSQDGYVNDPIAGHPPRATS
uniref:Uncharacterized protein n=1 Tax=Magallana gigas TaxID=29159 RepID=A0A8W8NV61_MAGGI